ncbi:MAG: polysaccharide biosynthesis protein [Oscillospiraceae bacterium]|nr:polysaccharide biosynthesis protein [Oscillospiraceae bacterium]
MSQSSKQSYLKGAAILTMTVAITKVLGFIYKIPIYNILGDEGTAYFTITYNVYSLLLSLGTAGIPVALSRLISAAGATERYNQVRRYYRVALAFMTVLGLFGAAVMFFFADGFAAAMHEPQSAVGIRVLAPAVLFAFLVAALRGYSQGHNDMIPTSISQISEVLCKLVFGLAIAWYLASAHAPLADVAGGAIAGVTIGMGLAVPVMALYNRRLGKRESAGVDSPLSRGETLREILRVGIPVTFSAIFLNIITVIDSSMIMRSLEFGAGFDHKMADVLFGAYSKAMTLYNLPIALVTPIGVSVVPVIAAAIATRRLDDDKATMESAIKVVNLIAMPCAVGLCVLAEPIFRLLYPASNPAGIDCLRGLGISSYFVCTYLITNYILQASGHERVGLLAMPIGGITKVIVNIVLVSIPAINIVGAVIGNAACYVLITTVNLIFIFTRMPSPPDILKVTLRPAICTAVMGVGAAASYGLCVRLLHPAGKLMEIVCLGAALIVAVIIYAALVLALKVISREDALLLPKGEKIAAFLHLK